ncbi:MAG: SGNH/GDSL hydrolase family protein [Pedobacter sp.]|nr:SGNH/GDSL hydrolase family protein [Chitinophagaceae bacterium]
MKNKLLLFAVTFFIALIAQSQTPTNNDYLKPVLTDLQKQWPNNRTINFVFHGHSVPSGYFNTPYVNTLKGYPHLTLCYLKERFPCAVVNVIITAIGGEQSEQGAVRFKDEVLTMRPDVLFIDYVLNDRSIGLERARVAWVKMIEEGLINNKKIILLTPSPDMTEDILDNNSPLAKHSDQIRELALFYKIGLVDSYREFKNRCVAGESLSSYMSQSNHPNEKGHQLIFEEIKKILQNTQN